MLFEDSAAFNDQRPRRLSSDDPAVCELERAFLYRIRVPNAGTERDDAPLEPLASPGEGEFVFPRPIREADAETRALWNAVADLAKDAVARARLHDLLFLLREGNPRRHADAAVRCYLEAVGGHLGALDEVAALCRAWTVTRAVGAHDAEAQVLVAL